MQCSNLHSQATRHTSSPPLFLVWLADLARLDQQAANRGLKTEGLDLESMGLSSVYIGGIRNQTEGVAAKLGLPPRAFPVFGMCVGYADPARPATVKPRFCHSRRYRIARPTSCIPGMPRSRSDWVLICADSYILPPP